MFYERQDIVSVLTVLIIKKHSLIRLTIDTLFTSVVLKGIHRSCVEGCYDPINMIFLNFVSV